MSELSKVLEKVRKKIAQHQGKGITEADTKIAMINPVLCALGWEVGNLAEVSLEYRNTPTDDPVDYALFLLGKLKLFVEAKALGQKVDGGKWANQIMGYAGVAGIKWVVLTNGDEYRIYNACVEVPFEEKLFRAVRLTDPNHSAEDILALFSKQQIGDIESHWKVHFADRKTLEALNRLFSPPPHRSLIRLVKKHVRGLAPKEIQASLARVHARFAFPVTPGLLSNGQATAACPLFSPVSLKELIDVGILKPGKLTASYKGTDLEAELLSSGLVRFQSKEYHTLSGAAVVAKYSVIGERKPTDGWAFWRYQNGNGLRVPLKLAKKEFRRNG